MFVELLSINQPFGYNINTVEPLFVRPPFVSDLWPFKRGGLSSEVEINTFLFRFTLSRGLFRGAGLLSG